ncbi:MAG: GxxExxY protein [Patescibacteria group bacterium]
MGQGGENKKIIIYPEISYEIMSIIFEAHNKVGNKWREIDFCNAIETLLIKRKINHEREKIVKLEFEGRKFADCRLDFIIENKIVLEVKKVWKITEGEIKQALRYLDATNFKLAIIVNFKHKRIEYRRVINPNFH